MFKHLKTMSGVMLILILALTACVSKASPTAEPTQPQPTQPQPTEPPKTKVTINFWHANTEAAEGPPMAEIIAAFNKIHPEIEVKQLWDTPLDKAMAAITAGNSPDLLIQWGPQFVGSWANAGALEPLDDYLKRGDVDPNDFIPGILGSTTYKDKIYGLPFGTDMSMLIYNADHFKAAGLDPEKPPMTTEELLQYAEKLTKVENGEITQIGWLPNYAWTHVAGDGSISVRFGPTFFHEDGTPGFDDPRWVEVFDFAKWVFDKYGIDNVKRFVSGFGEYGTAQDAICSGKLSMIYDGEWYTNFIKKNCPNLNYRVVPFPYPSKHPELKNNWEMGGTTVVMPAKAPHKEEAWQFLAFMQQPENIAKFCLSSTLGNIPHTLKALALYDNYKSNLPADFKYFIDLAKTGQAVVIPASPISDEYFTELSKTEEQIYNGTVSVEDGLKDLQKRLMDIYNQKVSK